MSAPVVQHHETLYNPYQGMSNARQLDETVDAFLGRLPASTTQVSWHTPWIFIANPYRKAPVRNFMGPSDTKFDDEGPPAEISDHDQFIVLATDLLSELAEVRRSFEMMEGNAKSTITRKVNPEKEKIARQILNLAIDLHVTAGKVSLLCLSFRYLS